MRLKKRLNNNAVIASDDQDREYVIFGNGIAFDIKKEETIPKDRIERVFFQKEKKYGFSFSERQSGIQVLYSSIGVRNSWCPAPCSIWIYGLCFYMFHVLIITLWTISVTAPETAALRMR